MSATVAITTTRFGARTHRLVTFPMTSVEQAREEFGATLADAKAFVLEASCTECGVEACSTQPCESCGAPTCGCLTGPHHDGMWFCEDCQPPACFGRCCE
jgi:hypothetical protein